MKKSVDSKKKRFKFFDMNRDGKGVYEAENRKPNLKFFFVLLWRKFSQLVRLNLLMLLQIVPIIGIILIFVLGAAVPYAQDPLYAPLYGITKIVESPALVTTLDMVGIQVNVPYTTTWMLVGMIALAVFLLVTFGWQNVGAAYVLRGLFRGDPVFVFTDFFYAIKKNFKQGFLLGIIDAICSAVLIFDIYFFITSGSSLVMDIMMGITVAIAIIYLFMRFYIYQLLITFDLSIFKILKNSLIFAILGVLRNVVASIGIVILLVLHLLLILWILPLGFSIPIVLPFVYIVAIIGFISVYAAYPVIDKYMIAPYNKNNDSEDPGVIEDSTESDSSETV